MSRSINNHFILLPEFRGCLWLCFELRPYSIFVMCFNIDISLVHGVNIRALKSLILCVLAKPEGTYGYGYVFYSCNASKHLGFAKVFGK